MSTEDLAGPPSVGDERDPLDTIIEHHPTPIRVLLVEDNDDDAIFVERALKDGGQPGAFQLRRTRTLSAAQRVLAETNIQVVLLDLSLPDVGGRNTIRKGLAMAGSVPVVVLTGIEDDGLALEAVRTGAQDYVVKRRSSLTALPRILLQALERHRALEELKASRAEFRDKAYRDPLTELPNRAYFLENLRQDMAIARRYGQTLALLFLDLDKFKEINDSLGHQAGDGVLRSVARVLRASVRESDSLCRYAGDEFIVLLRDLSDSLDALRIARKILSGIRVPGGEGGEPESLGASIGIAVFPGDAETGEELIRKADAAMYAAKKDGNTTRFFAEAMDTGPAIGLFHRMERGIQNGEFQVYYQPVVDGESGAVLGAEALTRWIHPEKGILYPLQFLKDLTVLGLLSELNEQVLRTATQQFMDWVKAGHGDLGEVSVNLSHSHIMDPGFPDHLAETLSRSGLAPRQLQVELPSRAVESDAGDEIGIVAAIRDLGVQVILDDLDPESSHFSRLRTMAVDGFKLDRSLVQNSHLHAADRAIVAALVEMARGMDLKVTAEGVERPEHRDFLLGIGCHRMQGFLFGRPVPASEFWGSHA